MYNSLNIDTFLCGKNSECAQYHMEKTSPSIYPVYYTNARYDVTKFVLGVLLQNSFPADLQKNSLVNGSSKTITSMGIRKDFFDKKSCHEYDEEWRMVCPFSLY